MIQWIHFYVKWKSTLSIVVFIQLIGVFIQVKVSFIYCIVNCNCNYYYPYQSYYEFISCYSSIFMMIRVKPLVLILSITNWVDYIFSSCRIINMTKNHMPRKVSIILMNIYDWKTIFMYDCNNIKLFKNNTTIPRLFTLQSSLNTAVNLVFTDGTKLIMVYINKY